MREAGRAALRLDADAVALIGSCARGSMQPGSDVDLLAVGNRRPVSPAVSSVSAGAQVNVIGMSWRAVRCPSPHQWLLLRLAVGDLVVLRDPSGRLRRALSDGWLAPCRDRVARQAPALLRQVQPAALEAVRQDGRSEAAQAYRFAKAAMFWLNAADRVFVADRDRAMRALADRRPALAPAVAAAEAGRGHYLAEQRDQPAPPPLTPTALDRALEGARALCDAVAEAALAFPDPARDSA